MPIPRLHPRHTALLVVDIQERLLPGMVEREELLGRTACLIEGVKALELPILVTEQYPKGLGPTVEAITRHLPAGASVFEKLKFSACTEPVREELRRLNTRSVVVAGIEAHVCILQTCLDLAGAGYTTAVAVDAISSRRPLDREAAVQRMIQSGVLASTVESALLELVGEAGGDRFRSVLKYIK